MIKDIQYPEAYLKPYEPVHIGEAQKGQAHYCFGCDSEMVIKRGHIRRHHFAHKAPFVECDSDKALHENAKAIICQGFLQAVDSGGTYNLGYPCRRCKAPIMVNVAECSASIASETMVVQGTRSDLVISQHDGITPRVIIEIVVHHDLEPETRQKYEESGIPVVKVAPTWDTLPDLRLKTEGYETLNVGLSQCKACRELEEEEKRRAEQQKQEMLRRIAEGERRAWRQDQETLRRIAKVRHLLAGITPYPGKLFPGKLSQLTSITHDRYGSPLKLTTRNNVTLYARRLVWLGFQQQPKRPTMFLHKAGDWKIYADLDSTEVMKIWEVDCVPAIYVFPVSNRAAECRECILESVGDVLERHMLPYRRHFEDNIGHNHEWFD